MSSPFRRSRSQPRLVGGALGGGSIRWRVHQVEGRRPRFRRHHERGNRRETPCVPPAWSTWSTASWYGWPSWACGRALSGGLWKGVTKDSTLVAVLRGQPALDGDGIQIGIQIGIVDGSVDGIRRRDRASTHRRYPDWRLDVSMRSRCLPDDPVPMSDPEIGVSPITFPIPMPDAS